MHSGEEHRREEGVLSHAVPASLLPACNVFHLPMPALPLPQWCSELHSTVASLQLRSAPLLEEDEVSSLPAGSFGKRSRVEAGGLEGNSPGMATAAAAAALSVRDAPAAVAAAPPLPAAVAHRMTVAGATMGSAMPAEGSIAELSMEQVKQYVAEQVLQSGAGQDSLAVARQLMAWLGLGGIKGVMDLANLVRHAEGGALPCETEQGGASLASKAVLSRGTAPRASACLPHPRPLQAPLISQRCFLPNSR